MLTNLEFMQFALRIAQDQLHIGVAIAGANENIERRLFVAEDIAQRLDGGLG